MKNIVDSSAWLEYFADSENARNFAKVIEDQGNLVVPSVILFEVFKKILLERDENTALTLVAHMKEGEIINLDLDLSIYAAQLSFELKIPMADSIILATAHRTGAIIWTQDSDFENISNVKYFQKK